MENAKIVISADADSDLEAMVTLVNNGFEAGRVKKNQMASWIIKFFRKTYFAKHIETVRSDHFDEIAHLESVIKQMKASRDGDGAVELNNLLAPVLQRQKSQQKNPPRKSQTTGSELKK